MSRRLIHSHTLKQNCYRLDVLEREPVTPPVQPATYQTLESVTTPTGVEERLVEHDYPCTPENANSWLASTDYKTQPEVAAQMPSRGSNLGDITELQRLLSNPDYARAVLSKISQLQEQAKSAVTAAGAAGDSAPTEGGNV